MPGPVSDSYDPQFGTGQNANDVRAALQDLRNRVTAAIGTPELLDIVSVIHADNERPGRRNPVALSEAELRVIRFAIDRTLETI